MVHTNHKLPKCSNGTEAEGYFAFSYGYSLMPYKVSLRVESVAMKRGLVSNCYSKLSSVSI